MKNGNATRGWELDRAESPEETLPTRPASAKVDIASVATAVENTTIREQRDGVSAHTPTTSE